MKKGILFLSILALALTFTSCQKEEPLEPAAEQTVLPTPTPITETTTTFVIGNTSYSGHVTILSELFGAEFYGCGQGTPPTSEKRFTFTYGQTYNLVVRHSITTPGTIIWEGDVTFDSSGNMTPSNITTGTATCSYIYCNGWNESVILFML